MIIFQISDIKYTAIFTVLHALLVPTTKKVTLDQNGKKSLIKYTIRDSQRSFLCFVKSHEELEEHLQDLQNRKENIQPFTALIGENLLHPCEIILYFDGIKFKFFHIIKAIDICFKIFQLFDFEYPLASSAVWIFLEKYFYKIDTKSKKLVFPAINMLLKNLDSSILKV